ncbi:MAG: hypothetical protein IPN68_15225 [Bacteroidetes bacterium]|nr:hypothetical protein [Bacteroidota bacterium]
MNQNKIFYAAAVLIISAAVSACSGNKSEVSKETTENAATAPAAEQKPVLAIDNETTLLLKDLEENGDYVNSQVFPRL